MAKLQLRIRAIKLRKNGESIKAIAKKLHVSTSTTSLWCRDVILSEDQIEKPKENHMNPYYGKRKVYLKKLQTKSIYKIQKLRERGIKEIGKLTRRELFIAGIALYWVEGFKKDKRLGFANSDPEMVKLFLKWLIKCCNVPVEDIRLRVSLNISHKDRVEEIEEYWVKITKISSSQFQKPYYQKFVWKKQYINRNDYYGVLRIRTNKQLTLFRKIHGWIDGLKQNTF